MAKFRFSKSFYYMSQIVFKWFLKKVNKFDVIFLTICEPLYFLKSGPNFGHLPNPLFQKKSKFPLNIILIM